MFEPKISIVIPVFNGANYLAEAIESALAQTYRNREIIIVDDGSNDDGQTRRIAESFGEHIRYIHQANGGCGAALNTGIAAMQGDYFSWLSHDDLYAPEKLSAQVERLAELADKKTILYSNYNLIDASGRLLHKMAIEQAGTREQLDTPLYPLTRGLIHGCTLLIHRTHFETCGVFDPDLKTTQDYDLWLRLLRVAPIAFMPDAFVLSRMHDAQSSRTITQMQSEGVGLWQRFIDEISPAEAEQMHGTHIRYLHQTARFLESTPYAPAAADAQTKIAQLLGRIRVSVVIPFRDRIDWTMRAVESVLAQSHANLDIILVDDGSSMDTRPLEQLAESDARLRYFRQEWQGPAAARNLGVSHADGRYVAFLDSDDWWDTAKIEKQLLYMEQEALALSHTSYHRHIEESGADELVDTSYYSGMVYPKIIAFCPMAVPTIMVRTEIMRQHPFPQGIHTGEDIITWLAIAERHPIGAMAEPLTTVRITAETTSVSPVKSLRGILNILSAVIDHPRHGHHHKEIVTLIDVLRRLELSRNSLNLTEVPLAQPAAPIRPPLLQQLRLRVSNLLFLAEVGFSSLRTYGLIATTGRFRHWLRRRRMRQN